MTAPDVDSELERLFGVARQETLPDVGARDRIRVGLASRLATSAPLPSSPTGGARRAWLGAGLAALVVGGGALWLTSSAPAPSVAPSVPLPTPVRSAPLEAAPPVVPVPSVSAPTVEAPRPKPAKPSPSSTRIADPAEELALVRSMQQALRSGNASQALSLAAEHTRRFPKGALSEEREGVRAVAQCRLAAPEARPAVLDAFTRRFGGSPYAARVKAACQ